MLEFWTLGRRLARARATDVAARTATAELLTDAIERGESADTLWESSHEDDAKEFAARSLRAAVRAFEAALELDNPRGTAESLRVSTSVWERAQKLSETSHRELAFHEARRDARILSRAVAVRTESPKRVLWRRFSRIATTVLIAAAGVGYIAYGYVKAQMPWTMTVFANPNLEGGATYDRASAVELDWADGGPTSGAADNFSVRMRSCLRMKSAGVLRIHASADDAVRVRIAGDIVLDDWTAHAAREVSATKELAAGVYPVAVEYYELGGAASLRARFESDGGIELFKRAANGSCSGH